MLWLRGPSDRQCTITFQALSALRAGSSTSSNVFHLNIGGCSMLNAVASGPSDEHRHGLRARSTPVAMAAMGRDVGAPSSAPYFRARSSGGRNPGPPTAPGFRKRNCRSLAFYGVVLVRGVVLFMGLFFDNRGGICHRSAAGPPPLGRGRIIPNPRI